VASRAANAPIRLETSKVTAATLLLAFLLVYGDVAVHSVRAVVRQVLVR
jgi:hypothetical protein